MKVKIYSNGKKLYIGDIAFIMCEDTEKAISAPEYKCGEQSVIKDGETLKLFSCEVSSICGTYQGSSGKVYSVDSGTIGVCPEDLFGIGWYARMEACGRTGRRIEDDFVTVELTNGVLNVWDSKNELIESINTK